MLERFAANQFSPPVKRDYLAASIKLSHYQNDVSMTLLT